MFNRRSFLSYTGGTTLTLFTYGKFGVKEAVAQVPVTTLDPASVAKFATPLLIPPPMPRASVLFRNRQWIDYYEISMKQFDQQILPAPLGKTTVWGYGPVKALSPFAITAHNAPSFTIEALHGVPVRIKWINDLKDASGNYLPHLLPVDPTLHWANPPGGLAGRDTRPTFTSTPGPYTGPVPMVTHVHGAVGVGDESDGYAEAWYLPKATNIPDGYAKEGTWYRFFAETKAPSSFGVSYYAPGNGYAICQYPNPDRAATKWYHDHTLGMTRLNVYAGPAGFYNIRGGPAGDLKVRDSRNGGLAVLPGPAPNELNYNKLIKNTKFYDIPIAIQDRSFNQAAPGPDGVDRCSLFYPDSRSFFDEPAFTGPYIPSSDVSPIWNPEFFGNMIMVNGNTWPFLEVEPRRYRFRFLNGCQARFLLLDFNKFKDTNGVLRIKVWQIGNEGGFLGTADQAPVNITSNYSNRLLMSPAERADLIVDFTDVPPGNYVLENFGPDEPFGGGEPGTAFEPADEFTTRQVMQFRVGAKVARPDNSTPAEYLVLPAITPLVLGPNLTTRKLALIEKVAERADAFDGPVEALLGRVDDYGNAVAQHWMDEVTENPILGDTEDWEFWNTTVDAHPMHVHEVAFQVMSRQEISLNSGTGKWEKVGLARDGDGVKPWETGFKDTVIAYPGQVTRIRAKFTKKGQYAWHCHIVEHEDNEMMRPYRIGDPQPGQPDPVV